MFDHVEFLVKDYEASKAFYSAALAPLGITLLRDDPEERIAGFGTGKLRGGQRRIEFLLQEGDVANMLRLHIAFRGENHATVDAFYKAGLAAGGIHHGKPGLRVNYHPTYYAAFLLDPDGHNIEAVCHE